MVGKIVSILCDRLIQHMIISENDREVYEYCFIVVITSLIFYSGIFLIMCFYKSFILPIVFTITYLLLRSYMGGWHASNIFTCMGISLLLFTIVVNLIIYPNITIQEKEVFSGFSVLYNGIVLFCCGMQDHPNRRLTQKEKNDAKTRAIILLATIIVLMVVFEIVEQYGVMFSMALACFTATTLLLLAKIQMKGKNAYETQ